jgi:hypothetical protein
MTPHVLNGAFERVARAEEHLADLRERIRRVSQLDSDVILAEFDPMPPHRPKVLIPELFYLSMRIPILTGEICYNLRSALDYLVFELAKLDSGAAQDFTQFPIEDTKKGFKGRINTYLKGVSTAHVACIAKLQPCMGCGWTKVLSFISNPDKHRELRLLPLVPAPPVVVAGPAGIG